MKSKEITYISNKQNWRLYIRDVFRFWQLIVQIAIRNIVVRYKQSLLGVLWALLDPILTLLIFIFVFGVLLQFRAAESTVPFPLIVISGLIGWQLFSLTLSIVGDSLLASQHILKQIYFPRIILCIGASFAVLVDFLIMLGVFFVILIIYRVPITPRTALVVPLLVHTYLLGLGVGLIISTLNIRYRDFKHVVPLMLKLGFYLSPVPYTIAAVVGQSRFPGWVAGLYFYNPMVGPINAMRWALLGTELRVESLWYSLAFTGVVLVLGVVVFFKREAVLADEA